MERKKSSWKRSCLLLSAAAFAAILSLCKLVEIQQLSMFNEAMY